MLYLKPSFTLPTSFGVTQEKWDSIFNPKPARRKRPTPVRVFFHRDDPGWTPPRGPGDFSMVSDT